MQVIDLLNAIANDQDTPYHISFYDRNLENTNVMVVSEENIIYYMNKNSIYLNDEVEPKQNYKIEKIKLVNPMDHVCNHYNEGKCIDYCNLNFKTITNKINELVECLNLKYE